MLLVNLLLWYDFLLETWNRKKEEWKEWGRTVLGPSPIQDYVLFANDDVILSSMNHHTPENALIYSSSDKTIKSWHISHTSLKLIKMPWLSLQCKVGDEVHDFSDWLSEVKLHTIPSLLSIVRLASHIHNVYIHEEHCKVEVINRDGEEKTYVFRGRRQLVEEKPIKHRDTMPYDNSDKIDPNSNDCMWGFYY